MDPKAIAASTKRLLENKNLRVEMAYQATETSQSSSIDRKGSELLDEIHKYEEAKLANSTQS